jgi:hypothetical protein
MSEGRIGPIEIPRAHLYDDNSLTTQGEESFTIIVPNIEARQILGLRHNNTNTEHSGPLNITTGDNPWGVVWIDTSNTLRDNEDILHRGWYIIIDAEPTTDLGAEYVHLQVTAQKISSNETEYLEQTYTPGVNDGTRIEHSYLLETEDYLLNDTFSTFSSSIWSAMSYSSATASPSITADGDLNFTCQGKVDGTAGQVVTQSVGTFNKPWTLELNMKYASTPTGYKNALNFFFGPRTVTASSANPYNNTVLVVLNVDNSQPNYAAYLFNASGSIGVIIPPTATSAKSINWKMVTDPIGYLTIYVDTGSGYVKKYHGVTWISESWNVKYTFQFANWDSTSATIESEFLKVYNMEDAVSNNIVALPATTPLVTPDFTRTSSDGTIPCYVNPSEDLYFYQEDASQLYKGAVKGYNSSYTDSTPRLITWTDETLDPADFYVTNGLVKLTTNASSTTPIVFSYYDPTNGWAVLNSFGLDGEKINLLKPISLGPEKQIYQINTTLWELNRGKPFVYVEHPNDVLSYTKGTSCYHDGVNQNGLAAGADVSMLTQAYALMYRPHNLLTLNAYNIETDTSGWNPVSSVLSQTGGGYGGTGYCLKVDTSNLINYEGVVQAQRSEFGTTGLAGLILNVGSFLRGSTTVGLYLSERRADNSLIQSTWSPNITLVWGTGEWAWYDADFTISSNETAKVDLQILTKTKTSTTFYVDNTQIAPIPSIGSNLWSMPPTSTAQYGMMIMKQDPTTIKSDSIPASEITGIGVYDQMQPPTSYNYYSFIGNEFLTQPDLRTNIRRI